MEINVRSWVNEVDEFLTTVGIKGNEVTKPIIFRKLCIDIKKIFNKNHTIMKL